MADAEDAQGAPSGYTYGAHGNLLTAMDPRGIQSRYQYDAENLYVTDKYEADGTSVQRHWQYTTDRPSGKVTLVRDADNSVQTSTGYDVFGRPTSVADPAKTTTTTYNDAARYKRTTTAGTGLTLDEVEYYDRLGRAVLTRSSETGSLGSIGSVSETYNQTGNGIKVERRFENLLSGRYEYISNPYRDRSGDATRGVTRRQYDAAGRLIEEATFSGSYPVSEANRTGTSTTSYSGPSHTATDPAGKVRTLTMDALGRLVKVVEAPSSENYTTSYTYTAPNNLTSVTQGTQTRTFVYDPLGRLTSATNPESGHMVNGVWVPLPVSYSYDDNGNLLTKTDALGVVTTMVYDPLNRVTSKSYSGGGTPAVTSTYDSCTQGKGRLCSVGNSVSTTNYTGYDALGRVTAGNQNTGGTAYSFSYVYNALGLTSMTYPSGRTVSYTYDAAGRASEVAGTMGGQALHYTHAVNTIQYAPQGAVSYMKLGNGVVETARYNSRLQADLLEAALGTSLWKQENFYCGSQATTCTSNNGNVISQRLTAPKTGGGTLVLSTAYGAYDGANRITSVAESGEGTGWSQSYGYGNNQFGNLSIAGDGDAQSLRCGSYDAASNRCNASGFVYDNAGNLTTYQGRTMAYDAENRQTSLSDGGSYEYDGEGRRVKKVAEGVTTVYVYDAMGRVAAEYASAAPTNQPDCTTCYLTVDHLGSTRLVTDGTTGQVKGRTDYHPFGWEINPGYGNRSSVTGYAATDEFNPKFTGKERDTESQLDYFGARYFDGRQGRFTTVDPSMQSVVLRNPQSWNRYAYTINNPLRYIDPNGELWIASGDSGRPYSWVDECENGKVCYTSVAAALKGVVRVYGSQNAKDIKDYTPNENGMIDLAAMASNDDSRFSIPGGTRNPDRFSTAEAAAAWFSATAQQDASIIITSASLASGKGDPVHPKSHGLPNAAIDFLYSDSSGRALWGPGSASHADAQRMQALFGLITAWGFNQTVSGRPADFGTGPKDVTSQNGRDLVQQHQNHGHVGIVERLRPPRR